jgi:hypothetical protein
MVITQMRGLKGLNLLLGRDRLELDAFIGINAAARRAALVQILFDMVPTKATDLFSGVRARSERAETDRT